MVLGCFVDGWMRARGGGVETVGRRLAVGTRQGPETSPLQSPRSSTFLSKDKKIFVRFIDSVKVVFFVR